MPCLGGGGGGRFVQKFVVGRFTKIYVLKFGFAQNRSTRLGTWNGVTGRAFGAGCVIVILTVFKENVSILMLRA
jgi:hypothetical protein